jgi:hypothetical protein
LRVTTEIEPDADYGTVKAEVVIGRGMWVWSMRHLLTNTIAALQQQKWTILSPPAGLSWITSDDPVIRLNYYGHGKYDFKGGWGNRGTEILLPLDSQHLLYTKVGYPRPQRGTLVPYEQALMLRRFAAEHAHRLIFAADPDPGIEMLRPRHVDADAMRAEQDQWQRWHQEQTAAERELMGW